MASPDGTEAIIGFDIGPSLFDDCSLRHTPCPQAASTDFRPSVNFRQNLPRMQKLGQSMSFLQLPSDDMDQSSMGILPCNLDASLLNLASVPLSVSLNKSRKHSTLPSIPESPLPQISSSESVDHNSDNVFYDGNEGNEVEEDKMGNLTRDSYPPAKRLSNAKDKFSISDLSKIEFRDDQISARSSTGQADEDHLVAKTFSQLFNKYSLDISDFMANEFKSACDDDDGLDDGIQSAETCPPEQGVHSEICENFTIESDASDIDGKYFHVLGDLLDNGLAADDDEFMPAKNCISTFKMAEEEFQQENHFLIPEKTFSGGTGTRKTESTNSGLSTSWVANANLQHVPRPSWLELDTSIQSHISFGQFIGLKTEALGKLDASVLSNVERPHFGISLPTAPSNNSGLTFSAPVDKNYLNIPINKAVDEPYLNSSVSIEGFPKDDYKLGIPNDSTINNLLAEVSLSRDYKEFTKPIVQASVEGKFAKVPKQPMVGCIGQPRSSSDTLTNRISEGSGASSTLTDNRSSESMNTGVLQVKKQDSPAMKDKFVQVSFSEDLPSVPVTYIKKGTGDVCPGKFQDCPESSGKSGNFTEITLRPLRADVQDFRQCVIVPSEINIKEWCCVGTSIDAILRLSNPSLRWLECSLRLQKLTCNGKAWNVDAVPPFLRNNSRWMLEPNAPHFLKMVIIPPAEGRWEALLQLYVRTPSLVTNDGTQSNEWHPYPLIPLKVNAEIASVATDPENMMDFGLLPEECLSISQILVTNTGKSKLPLRLVIEGSFTSGQGFYFPQENAASVSAMQGASACILNCIIEKELASIKVPIAFKAQLLSHQGDNIQTVSATLRIELDVPGPSPLLKKVALRAFVGPVKLCTNEEMIELTYPTSSTKSFPLRNVGTIPLKLSLVTDAPQELSVVPGDVELMPSQGVQVQLMYHPTDISGSLESFLKIQVLPGGSFYKIMVVGNTQSHPPITQASRPGNHLSLHSDCRYLYWGTVDLGCSVRQQFTLRNVSPTEQLCLTLKIKMDDRSGDAICPFQLVEETPLPSPMANVSSMPPPSYRLVPHKNVTLQPGEEQSVKVYFSPRNSAHFSGKLVIRPRRMAHSLGANSMTNFWVKFTIPLRGYGGIAIVTFSDLQPSNIPAPAHFCAPSSSGLHIISSSAHNTIQKINCDSNGGVLHFAAKNVGQRAAFVKILISNDKNSIVPLPNLLTVTVQPTEFVLSEGSSRQFKVNIQPHSSFPTFYLILFLGEEILRQRFCLLPVVAGEDPVDKFYRAQLKLNDAFQNETPLHISNSDPLWPSCHADRTQLLASLRTTWVLIQPTVRANTSRSSTSSVSPSVADLDEDPPNGVFVPLDAEETFSDVTLSHRDAPSSPPSKEETFFRFGNEGIIQVESNTLTFPPTQCGQSSISKVVLKNIDGSGSILVNVLRPSTPFHVNYNQVKIKPKHYLSFPVMFRPSSSGSFSSTLYLNYKTGQNTACLSVDLQGNAY